MHVVLLHNGVQSVLIHSCGYSSSRLLNPNSYWLYMLCDESLHNSVLSLKSTSIVHRKTFHTSIYRVVCIGLGHL